MRVEGLSRKSIWPIAGQMDFRNSYRPDNPETKRFCQRARPQSVVLRRYTAHVDADSRRHQLDAVEPTLAVRRPRRGYNRDSIVV